MRIRIASLALFALVAGTGCVSTQSTMLATEERARVDADQVRVYRTIESIGCEYEEVAIINAQGSTSMTNEAGMVRAGKARAGRVGANGLVLGAVNEPSAGAQIAGAIFGVGTQRRGEMLAVYVFEPCRPTGEGASSPSN